LKLAQREFANEIGVRLITWTYDPLESRNGWLNIGKLGCVCDQYLRDFHGVLGGINAGLATDRFEVSWWITGSRAKSRTGKNRRGPLSLDSILAGGALLVNEAQRDDAGLLRPAETTLPLEANLLLVEIPAQFQVIKREELGLAQAWRQHTRALFEQAFAAGYAVTDFARETRADGEQRVFYVLTHGAAWR
jgi:predicted GNAT superfamily acetyltransferase